MLRGNAQVVRAIVDALNRADVGGMLARMDPDFEWTPVEGSLVATTHRGHEEVRRYVEDWLRTFDDLRIDVEDLSEAGEHVVAVVRGYGRGRASGVQPPNRFCQVWTVRSGVAVRMREYSTREEGLEALRSQKA
jgi:ketosteroid isomerase-like protein